ncbi:MAG: Hpt domain-containing protein [Magnetococcales bacterium]|nr:Hpt domain-containing protein [Magnetococcales bacterium]
MSDSIREIGEGIGGEIGKITVMIDRELEQLIPGYLANRWKDVAAIEQALAQGDQESIRILGHRMKGSGAGYGFEEITAIGRQLEQAADQGDQAVVAQLRQHLVHYLESIEITYVG